MCVFGTKFAPLSVPFKRHLEIMSLTCLVFCLSIGLFGCPILTTYLFFLTKYYWIIAMYLIWMAYDSSICDEGGRRSETIRNLFVWRYIQDYFPLKLIRDSKKPFDPKKNYFFICHPHGIWCTGIVGNMAIKSSQWKKLFPDIKPYISGLRLLFFIPFFRDLLLALGIICASQKSINYVFNSKDKGNAVALMVGGAAESLNSHPNTYRFVIKPRTGFVKLALKNGVSLVPVISFGEVDLYSQVSNPHGSLLRKVQDLVRRTFKLAPVIFYGRGIFQYKIGLLPYRKPVTTVVGEPIDVEKVEEPTKEQIKELHSKFIQSITNLFDKYKHVCLDNASEINLIID